ncbi:MAG: metallophosphatase family protein [Eubacterium sp.]|nr:metallophosphatase family protein [Eubacterium sp.]
MDVLVMSDIHGNITALDAVLHKAESKYEIGVCILLGDVIDYGMHPNEVIAVLQQMKYPVICNIWGNHECAVINKEYASFSTERGRECALYTESILGRQAWKYIREKMQGRGEFEFVYEKKKCLAVHGSAEDVYWKSIQVQAEMSGIYEKYDYVFSGHSHIPHFFEKYYETDDIRNRNKKKVIFINPGSVGQPRNLNPMAQFAVVDLCTEKVIFDKAVYDIAYEQRAMSGRIDEFYSERLKRGI